MKKQMKYLLMLSILLSGCTKKQIQFNDKYAIKEGEEGHTSITLELGEIPNLDPMEYLSPETSEERLANTTLEIFEVIDDSGKTPQQPVEDPMHLDVGNYVVVIQEGETTLKVPFEVKDTIAPQFIDFKERFETEEGKEFTLEGKFEATDLTEVTLTFEGEIDLNTPGDYHVLVIAKDKSGNVNQAECRVTVTPKPKANETLPSHKKNESNQQEETQPLPTPKQQYLQNYAQEVVNLVNQERVRAGLAPLVWDQHLASCADIRAQEIMTTFSHTRPNGSDCFSIITEPYFRLGENIAAGYFTPVAVMDGWMNSQGHRANILTPEFNVIGVSCYLDETSEYQFHWVQLFGTK